MKHKTPKTNAMRILDSRHISYGIHEYDISDGLIDGTSVCDKVGAPAAQFFKTLVARGADKRICVLVINANAEVDLKKAAALAGEKNMELIHVKELEGITGYIRGGCAPIGMKKNFDTYYDDAVNHIPLLYVSGGKKGMAVSVKPEELIAATNGTVGNIVRS